MPYRVFVDDNFHFMDESERYALGEFATLDQAVAACQRLVDAFLGAAYTPGMSAAELTAQYATFGEDPFIVSGDGRVPFSAHAYANERIQKPRWLT